MTADQLLQYLTWLLYLVIFALVVGECARQRTPAHVDMMLFFADTAAIILLSTVFTGLGAVPPPWVPVLTGTLVMALPYLLLRLVADFSSVPGWLLRVSELGVGVSLVAIMVLPTPMPVATTLTLVTYFVALTGYDTWAFIRQALRSSGVTRRRMQAIASGAICLGLVLVLAGLAVTFPSLALLWSALSEVAGLASGLAFFIGFAPPTWLRRAWQDPEVRAFLGRAATLPHLPDTPSIIQQLEAGAAAALGAPSAAIGLWDAVSERLRFVNAVPPSANLPASSSFHVAEDSAWALELSAKSVSAIAFREQRGLLVADVQRQDPENAELYRKYHARAALATPITAGEKRLGVLVAYAPRAPVFAASDMELLRLLADQAAVILESRALIDQAARVQAREEATRLKEDFLSSAAHDLKTPLTGMLTQTQMLQRHAQRDPSARPDPRSIERLLREARRLKSVVVELLDAAQLERAEAPNPADITDLGALLRDCCAARPRCRLEAPQSLPTRVNAAHAHQVFEHLVANALKFDPSGGEILVQAWAEEEHAHVSISDHGIGIQPDDLPHVFERFHRGRNVDDRRFAGLGLGLYISRRAVEQHGGRIWAESKAGLGTTVHVELPLAARENRKVGQIIGAAGRHA